MSDHSSFIPDAFDRLFHSRPGEGSARKWWNIDCPMCGDKRKRLGLIREGTGFSIFCLNGGCNFHDKGWKWETGGGLFGKLADLYRKLGGDLSAVPPEVRKRTNGGKKISSDRIVKKAFDEVSLLGSIPLVQALDNDPRSHAVGDWLVRRSEVYFYPEYQKYFFWSKMSPNKLRIAYIHYDRVVGWLDRDITKGDGEARFIQKKSPDYLFGQHRVHELPGPHVIVVESPLDAILLHGVATMSSKPTQVQINFLLESGKTPIWVPDLKDQEGRLFVEVAQANQHLIALPNWTYKDPGEAFAPLGVLHTAHLILEAKTNMYSGALHRIKRLGK